jgi:hypothetical protein
VLCVICYMLLGMLCVMCSTLQMHTLLRQSYTERVWFWSIDTTARSSALGLNARCIGVVCVYVCMCVCVYVR